MNKILTKNLMINGFKFEQQTLWTKVFHLVIQFGVYFKGGKTLKYLLEKHRLKVNICLNSWYFPIS